MGGGLKGPGVMWGWLSEAVWGMRARWEVVGDVLGDAGLVYTSLYEAQFL